MAWERTATIFSFMFNDHLNTHKKFEQTNNNIFYQ